MALAIDATSNGGALGASVKSWSHTCTGSDRAIVVGVWAAVSGSVTGVTYTKGGTDVAMTQVQSQVGSVNTYYCTLWYLANPDIGSGTVKITASSGNVTGGAVSFTGAADSPLDTSTTASTASSTSYANSITTVTANSWAVILATGSQVLAAGTGITNIFTQNTCVFGRASAITNPAGATSMTTTCAPAGEHYSVMLSIKEKLPSTSTQCIAFNGSSQYASATDSASLSPTGDQTHEGWVKWTTLPTAGNEATIFAKYTSTSNQRGISVTLLNTGGVYSFQARTSSDGSGVSFNNTNLLQTPVVDTWYHYRFVYIAASSKITFYVNGMNALDITGLTGSIYNNTAAYTLGWAFDTAYAAAKFANWRVWDAQHTTEDIMINHGTTATNLKAEWSLNNSASDTSGNSNTFTYTGSPSYSTDTPFPYQQVSGNVLEGNLVSYWAFNESSGNATDSKGSNTLTNVNTATFVTGKQGNGTDLEAGSSQRFTRTDASYTGWPTGVQSYACWIKPESLPTTSGLSFIISKNGATSGTYVGIDGTGHILFSGSDGTANTVTSVATLSTGTWYHIACVYTTSASMKIYINGALDINDTTGIPSTMRSTTQDMYVGIQANVTGDTTYHFDGIIDELGQWGTNLSPESISALYNAGTGIPYTATASSSIKTVNGLAKASVKTVNGLAIASVKTWEGLA